jgi:ABC-type phosphate/phosphonate transport system substrate-binding protein
MARLAFLPMAALPELRVAKAAFWSALATELVRAGVQDVPTELTVSEDLHGTWQHPNLLFSQTCGYPLVLGLDEHVQLVATPVYTAQGCVGANYSSAVVVRDGDTATSLEDLRGRRCAFNSVDSQSGYNVLRLAVARIAQADTFFSEVVETGGHLASLTAVVQGRADVAAIDCVGFASMRKYRPELTQRVRVLFFTDSAPGLPFITSRSTSPVELVLMRKALGTVFKSHSLETTRTTLLLKNVEVVSRDTYTLLTEMETEAVALGYPRLA